MQTRSKRRLTRAASRKALGGWFSGLPVPSLACCVSQLALSQRPRSDAAPFLAVRRALILGSSKSATSTDAGVILADAGRVGGLIASRAATFVASIRNLYWGPALPGSGALALLSSAAQAHRSLCIRPCGLRVEMPTQADVVPWDEVQVEPVGKSILVGIAAQQGGYKRRLDGGGKAKARILHGGAHVALDRAVCNGGSSPQEPEEGPPYALHLHPHADSSSMLQCWEVAFLRSGVKSNWQERASVYELMFAIVAGKSSDTSRRVLYTAPPSSLTRASSVSCAGRLRLIRGCISLHKQKGGDSPTCA